MKKHVQIFLLAVLFSVFGASVSQAAISVGDQAPDFKAQDTKGMERSLSAYKGKFIVLEWFNFDCPFVKKHYGSGNMQELQKKYTQQGVIWISICSSAMGNQGYYGAEETNRIMGEKEASPTAVIVNPEGTIGRMYGAATTPHLFIIDPQGRLIYQGAIDSIAGTDPGEIAQADNYVKKALDASLKGDPIEVSATKSYGCSVKY